MDDSLFSSSSFTSVSSNDYIVLKVDHLRSHLFSLYDFASFFFRVWWRSWWPWGTTDSLFSLSTPNPGQTIENITETNFNKTSVDHIFSLCVHPQQSKNHICLYNEIWLSFMVKHLQKGLMHFCHKITHINTVYFLLSLRCPGNLHILISIINIFQAILW